MSVAFKKEFEPFMPGEPFGRPGVSPNWARGAKTGVGTALSDTSKVWFTIAEGVITEVYYPTVDMANTKDMRFLVTDGKTFFDEEGKDTSCEVSYIDAKAPAYKIVNTAKSGSWSITKKVLTDPGANSLVINVEFTALKGKASDYHVYLLFAPHVKNRGYENSGRCVAYGGNTFLTAWREDIAAALTSDVPFLKMSAGYSGYSDGWHDLKDNYQMDWLYERAENGNIALMAEVEPGAPFNIVLSFGRDELEAVLETTRTLGRSFRAMERDYIKEWKSYMNGLENLGKHMPDKGKRFYASAFILKTHEDKTHKGGLIASLSVPWGEVKGDMDAGGYHLVWPRDLVKSALAFMAMGDTETAVNTLKFLQKNQNPDGSWPQNFWLDGKHHWEYVQLDQVALPIILAWKLRKMGAVGNEFYLMVKRAASYIVKYGPVTEQERWEENMGFSPSTLAAEVAALVSAGHWAKEAGEDIDGGFLLSVADSWASRIEEWTFSECDCMGEDVPGHYLRIVHDVPESLAPSEQVCHALVFNRNRPRDVPHHQGELVDASFFDLVRYGVRAHDEPHILSSTEVVDRFIRFDSPLGVAFYRFNGDGYGEKEDGSPFDGSGVGRPWPLITAERAMYEALAGRDPQEYVSSLEAFANEGLMFPEQIWDGEDMPEKNLYNGRGTGSATPLIWAHAEYIKILRTVKDWKGCDVIPEVQKRYARERTALHMSAWKSTRPIRIAKATDVIRVIAFDRAHLVWTADGWATRHEDQMTETGLGLFYIDFRPGAFPSGSRLEFTFYYPEKGIWEGRNHDIRIF